MFIDFSLLLWYTLYEKVKVKFKIYGLNYIIEKIDNVVVIYSELYPNQKLTYDSINLVFTDFLIYNEI